MSARYAVLKGEGTSSSLLPASRSLAWAAPGRVHSFGPGPSGPRQRERTQQQLRRTEKTAASSSLQKPRGAEAARGSMLPLPTTTSTPPRTPCRRGTGLRSPASTLAKRPQAGTRKHIGNTPVNKLLFPEPTARRSTRLPFENEEEDDFVPSEDNADPSGHDSTHKRRRLSHRDASSPPSTPKSSSIARRSLGQTIIFSPHDPNARTIGNIEPDRSMIKQLLELLEAKVKLNEQGRQDKLAAWDEYDRLVFNAALSFFPMALQRLRLSLILASGASRVGDVKWVCLHEHYLHLCRRHRDAMFKSTLLFAFDPLHRYPRLAQLCMGEAVDDKNEL
ncbi:hypothetical protein GGTG_04944 [Gaeumannomyces tritici R3-111a-1]|uniref:Uncharacterized protein n=1 Tax=Gaeumannomyces tritici (strain R3-111a-1) TaxID=644352 RepID=J3NUI8_GAET3|nr:hypothetical protein GGTG_04944 [Gaeumannomyces tritici R3-111a-1]EJT79861.1 hypothetical protein GGTG_04944 [Gaeumannomyces tritici R3-111a-1]